MLDDEQSEYAHLPDGQEAHWEIVERILFIFAKLNPGQSYVQGMNEICGPIYYTFATDPDVEWRSRTLESRRKTVDELMNHSLSLLLSMSLVNRARRSGRVLLLHQADGRSGHSRQLPAVYGQHRIRHWYENAARRVHLFSLKSADHACLPN